MKTLITVLLAMTFNANAGTKLNAQEAERLLDSAIDLMHAEVSGGESSYRLAWPQNGVYCDFEKTQVAYVLNKSSGDYKENILALIRDGQLGSYGFNYDLSGEINEGVQPRLVIYSTANLTNTPSKNLHANYKIEFYTSEDEKTILKTTMIKTYASWQNVGTITKPEYGWKSNEGETVGCELKN